VVTEVFDAVLDEVISGTLVPGQRISDADLAARFGVSRTPVREALQRLREIGVIEASPSRFTRVAEVTPLQTAHAFTVWRALYLTLLEEVIPFADAGLVPALETYHREYGEAVTALDAQGIATANFRFFTALHELSGNPILRRALVSVVHIVRLGSLYLPAYVDVAALGDAQATLIRAVRDRDLDEARAAMEILGRIVVPQEDPDAPSVDPAS
jgi:DNA-binding GntR family transcriptional regulator